MKFYLDCEFDGFGGPLISVGLVPSGVGHGRYWVLKETAEDPWVREHVLPILWGGVPVQAVAPLPFAGAQVVATGIANYLAGFAGVPVIVTDWPADIRYFCELIEFEGGRMAAIPGLAFEMVRVDAYPTRLVGAVQHNAWWDACALRARLEPDRLDRAEN